MSTVSKRTRNGIMFAPGIGASCSMYFHAVWFHSSVYRALHSKRYVFISDFPNFQNVFPPKLLPDFLQNSKNNNFLSKFQIVIVKITSNLTKHCFMFVSQEHRGNPWLDVPQTKIWSTLDNNINNIPAKHTPPFYRSDPHMEVFLCMKFGLQNKWFLVRKYTI